MSDDRLNWKLIKTQLSLLKRIKLLPNPRLVRFTSFIIIFNINRSVQYYTHNNMFTTYYIIQYIISFIYNLNTRLRKNKGLSLISKFQTTNSKRKKMSIF